MDKIKEAEALCFIGVLTLFTLAVAVATVCAVVEAVLKYF